jgi:hypothetical protein
MATVLDTGQKQDGTLAVQVADGELAWSCKAS